MLVSLMEKLSAADAVTLTGEFRPGGYVLTDTEVDEILRALADRDRKVYQVHKESGND